jgi:hypothetical protein
MMWTKQAEKIVEIVSPIDLQQSDIDSIAYYAAHFSSPTLWGRLAALGRSLVHYSNDMSERARVQEGEQLWLPFDQ